MIPGVNIISGKTSVVSVKGAGVAGSALSHSGGHLGGRAPYENV